MTFGITAGQALMAGSAILGGVISSSGAQSAASTQADAANRAADLQKQQFDQQMALQDPFRTAGLTAQNALLQKLGLGGDANAPGYGQYAKDFSMADYQADPGYAFRLSEGMKQLGSQARARGGAVGGRTMMAGQQYAQDLASQEYQGAFNRYQTNRANQLAPLGSLMSSGQAAASNQAGSAGQYGVNAGNLMTQAGQSIAAGQMGAANSLASGLGTAASAYQQQSNFNNWLARQPQTPVAYTGGNNYEGTLSGPSPQ